jgi:N-acyl-D-aspartate/D-glutamate deacylase
VAAVDTRDGALTPGADVFVRDGVIAAITTSDPDPTGAASVNGAEVVDGSGQYLVPGYLDMHAHPLTASRARSPSSSRQPQARSRLGR